MVNRSTIASSETLDLRISQGTRPTWDAWITIPAAAGRALSRWTKRTEGASSSPMGGHITLLSEANGRVASEDAIRAVGKTCSLRPSFSVTMSHPRVDDYWPHPDRRIVMLACDAASESSVHALRKALTTALNVDPTSLWPERSGHEFLPHVSLAVGISPDEAARVCEQARFLVLEFSVTELTVGCGPTVVTHTLKALP